MLRPYESTRVAEQGLIRSVGRSMLRPNGGSEALFALDHLPPPVLPAARAGAGRQLGLAAVGAGRHGGQRQRVMGAALVPAGFGMASFRIRHGRRASSDLQSPYVSGPGQQPGVPS